MRLDGDLSLFIHHDGNEMLVGEVDFLIPKKNKLFILNSDKSISPASDPEKVIGVRRGDVQKRLYIIDRSSPDSKTNRLKFK